MNLPNTHGWQQERDAAIRQNRAHFANADDAKQRMISHTVRGAFAVAALVVGGILAIGKLAGTAAALAIAPWAVGAVGIVGLTTLAVIGANHAFNQEMRGADRAHRQAVLAIANG